MKVKVKTQLEGRFCVTIMRNGKVREKHDFKNIITNAGRDMLGNPSLSPGSGFGPYSIAVGTGNTTPKATDTQLDNILAVLSNPQANGENYNTSAPFSYDFNISGQFAQGAVVGNITEIACVNATDSTTYTCFSRALTQVNGQAAAITVTAEDQLTLSWSLTVTFAAEVQASMSLTTDGALSTVSYQAIPANMQNLGYLRFGVFGDLNPNAPGYLSPSVTSFPGADSQYGGTQWNGITAATYTAGSYKQSCTFHLNTGHDISINYLSTVNQLLGGFQFLFASNISIAANQTFDFTLEVDWSA